MKQKKTYTTPTTTATPLEPTYVIAGTLPSGNGSGPASGAAGKDIDGSSNNDTGDSGSSSDDLWNLEW